MRLCLSSTMRCLRSSGASTRRFLVWLRHACSNSSLRPWRDLWAANSSSCLWWGWCRPRWKRRTGGRKENRNTSQNLMRMRRFTKNNFWYCCCEKNRSTNVLIFCLNSLNLIFFFFARSLPCILHLPGGKLFDRIELVLRWSWIDLTDYEPNVDTPMDKEHPYVTSTNLAPSSHCLMSYSWDLDWDAKSLFRSICSTENLIMWCNVRKGATGRNFQFVFLETGMKILESKD